MVVHTHGRAVRPTDMNADTLSAGQQPAIGGVKPQIIPVNMVQRPQSAAPEK